MVNYRRDQNIFGWIIPIRRDSKSLSITIPARRYIQIMLLCIRNRVKNASFIIFLIIRYLIIENTKAIADIYANLLRIQNLVGAREWRVHRC